MSHGCEVKDVIATEIPWHQWQPDTLTGNYTSTIDSSCLIEKGALFMNSSLSTTVELSHWFNRSDIGEKKCMKFPYMMFGTGALSLMVLQKIPGFGENVIWINENATDHPVWKYGEVSVGMATRSKIYFRGQFRADSPGVLVIANGLYFANEYCNTAQKYVEKAYRKVLTSPSGVITSPLYPATIPRSPGTHTWHIRVPEGMIVRLTPEVFRLGYSEDQIRCTENYLAVYDGPKADPSLIIGRYCKGGFPLIESTSSDVVLKLFIERHLSWSWYDSIRRFRIKYSTKAAPHGQKDSVRCPSSCRCSYIICTDVRRLFIHGTSLSIVPGNIPDDAAVLLFAQNRIHRLKVKDFNSKKVLEYIDLSSNRLLYIDDRAFNVLQSIQTIKLSMNFLRSLNQETFYNLSSLEVLDLSENLIDKIHPDAFKTLTNLKVLKLQSNYISEINPKQFQGNPQLQCLYLNDNKIKKIAPNLFQGLYSLTTLRLKGNKLAVVPERTFSDTKNLKRLEVDYFMLCCFAKTFAPNVYCDAPADEFSSCDDLMKNKAARASIWILGILAFLGNICVVAWRLTLSEENRVQSLLLTNLAISDFLMGVYLLIIAVKDAQWQKVYFTKDFEWRNGRMCQFTGALSMLSSEVSVMMLTVITADRFKSIVYPMKFGKLSYKSAFVICLIVWVFGLIISFLPTSGLEYFYDVKAEMGFYGRSSVCLPLQLSTSRLAGWEYSVSIFIALNFASFVFIFFAYLGIFITVKKSSAKAKSKNAKKEAAMAWKVMAIILTDFCCWMPVIVMGILSLTGDFHDPQGLAYVWIAVFVLPVNSSINPILYTFSNADVRKKFTSYFLSKPTGGDEKTPLSKVVDNTKNKDFQVPPMPTNLKLNEASTVLQSGNGVGYLTCYAENDPDSLLLLKCFIPENHVDWIREVNVLKLLKSETENEKLMICKWQAKVKNLNIEANDIEIPGMPLSSDCSVICFGFSPNYIPLIKFLQGSEVTARVENLFAAVLDVLKAVEELHKHGVSHGDIASHNVLIEPNVCEKSPPIRAVLCGFDKARIVKSTSRAAQAYKTDVHQVGSLIEEMMTICGHYGEFEEVSDVIEMCFHESPEWRQRITEIRMFFEQALDDGGCKEQDTRL